MHNSGSRLVQWAYRLEATSRYLQLKRWFYDLLENPHSVRKRWADLFLLTLVIVTVAILIYDVKHQAQEWHLYIDEVAVVIFILEYLGRFWLSSDSHRIIIDEYERCRQEFEPFEVGRVLRKVLAAKWAFISSPMSIIDLIAILPSYRPLRFLRILLLFRLFKIFRYTAGVNEFLRVVIERKFEFAQLAVLVAFVVFLASTAFYIFEGYGQNEHVGNYFDSIYWAVVSVATVGYGDISPTTTEGRVVAMFLIITGVAFIAFSTSIATTALSEKLAFLKEERERARIHKMKDYIIVCGYGKVGRETCARMAAQGIDLVVLDPDPLRIEEARENGLVALCEDASHEAVLVNVGIRHRARALICLTGNDLTNIYIAMTARSLSHTIHIISDVKDSAHEAKYRLAGVDKVISATRAAAHMGLSFLTRPAAYEVLEGLLFGRKGVVLEEIEIPPKSPFLGRRAEVIDFGALGLLLLGYKNERQGVDFGFNPKLAELEITEETILIVMGRLRGVVALKGLLTTGVHHA